jgi:hypothetical protein
MLERAIENNQIIKTSFKNENHVIDYFRDLIFKNDELIIQNKINICVISPNLNHCEHVATMLLSDFEFLQQTSRNGCNLFYTDTVNIHTSSNSFTGLSTNHFDYLIILFADYMSVDLLNSYLITNAKVIMTVDSKHFELNGHIIKEFDPNKTFMSHLMEILRIFRCCINEE